MTVFAFEEDDGRLTWIPMAARRALDAAGCKLSLEAWQGMSLEARREVVRAGAEDRVDPDRVRGLLRHAEPAPAPLAARPEPAPDRRPPSVAAKLPALSEAGWRRLTPLSRYVLAHLARRDRDDKLRRAYAELRPPS
ncbi:MAG: nitrate reductase associated protein [Sandaracinaceae bacterium]